MLPALDGDDAPRLPSPRAPYLATLPRAPPLLPSLRGFADGGLGDDDDDAGDGNGAAGAVEAALLAEVGPSNDVAHKD